MSGPKPLNGFPSPTLNDLNAPFWSAGQADRLVLPFCVTTGRAFWPPSPISPFVTSGPVEWGEAKPSGIIRSVIVYRRIFHADFKPLAPYGVGLIELDAGPRLMAYVPAPDEPMAPRAGDRGRIEFITLPAGQIAIPALFRMS